MVDAKKSPPYLTALSDAHALEKTMEEAEIVTAVLGGQTDRFRHLVERYHSGLASLMFRLVGNRTDAEDLAQQSFLDAFQSLPQFDPKRRFSTWLYRIAINNAKDHLKSHKRKETSLERPVANHQGMFSGSFASPDDALFDQERTHKLLRGLMALPVKYREVVVLKEVEGLSFEEIRQILGYSMPTLKIRAVRGRAALKEWLEKNE